MKDRKLKLLFFSSDRHPAKRVDVSVLFGEELVSRGHDIDFVFQAEKSQNHAQTVEWLGADVFVGPMDERENIRGRISKHFWSLFHDFRVAWSCRKKGYDVFQLKDKYVSALFLIPLCKIYGIKFVYWLSWPFPEESLLKSKSADSRYPLFYAVRGHFFDFVFYRLIKYFAEFIFVQSEQMKKDLHDRGVPLEKMMAVPMGISKSWLDVDLKAIEGNIDTVLYLGTLARVRKMDFLLRVFARVLETMPNTRLVLVGGGDDDLDMEILMNEADALGIRDSVVFTGWVPMDEAFDYVMAASVCVSPFFPTPIFNSTSPTKLVEYMALKKAVVANDHPEQKLVIESSGGGLCVPYDEELFASAIVDLLRDPELRQRMGESGRAFVQSNRLYSRIADLVECKYRELVKAS